MIGQISVLLLLGVCSCQDFKRKQICTGWLAVFAAEGMLYGIFVADKPPVEIMIALIPGCCVLALSFFTCGAIGQGDGLLLMTMGFFLDAIGICMIFVSALFLSAAYALFLYYIRKKNRKYEIAFVPFLLAAYIWSLCMGK